MTTVSPNPTLPIDQASAQLESGVTMFAQGERFPAVMQVFKTALVGMQRLLVVQPDDRSMHTTTTSRQQQQQQGMRFVQVPHLVEEGFYIHNHALLWSEIVLSSWQERDGLDLSCVLAFFNLALLLTQDGKKTPNHRNLRKALRLYDAAIELIAATGHPSGSNSDLDFVQLASLNNKAWILKHLGQEVDARDLHRQLVMLFLQAREQPPNGHEHWSRESLDIILNFVGNFSVTMEPACPHLAPSA